MGVSSLVAATRVHDNGLAEGQHVFVPCRLRRRYDVGVTPLDICVIQFFGSGPLTMRLQLR